MIRAVFFDIGGTVHVQYASSACDRNYAQRLWEFLNRHDMPTEESPALLLSRVDAGAKVYKRFCEKNLIELPPDQIWQAFMLRWPLMIQIDNPLTYHKDAAYQECGLEADARIQSLPELIDAIECFNKKLKEGA